MSRLDPLLPRNKGFTLIEILLVMVIAGLVIGVGATQWKNNFAIFQLESERNKLAQWMEHQQEKAVLTGKPQKIVLYYGTNGRYEVYEGVTGLPTQTITVNPRFKLADGGGVSGGTFTFNPDGTVTGGTVIFQYSGITNPADQYKVVTNSGLLTLEPEEK